MTMALLKYLKSWKDGLSDPTGSLASEIPSIAMVQANREVRKLREAGQGKAKAWALQEVWLDYRIAGCRLLCVLYNTVDGMILSLGLKSHATRVLPWNLILKESSVQCIK